MAIIRQVDRRVTILQNTEAEVSTSQTIAPQYTWTINGIVTAPTEVALDALHQIDAEAQLHEVRVSARVAGDSQYRIQIINRNLLGANTRVLVDQTLTFSGDREIYSLVIADATLEQHSSLEVSIHEVVVGPTPATDITISAIVENFGTANPVRNGHVIQRDDNTSLPQQDILKFVGEAFSVDDNVGDGKTEVSVTKQALIDLVYPVGAYLTADVTEAQFQSQMGSGWVLCDGRSVVGSSYETLTGNANIPDARGMVLRGKNEGRTDGNENPDGEIALGTYQADQFESHNHTFPIAVAEQSVITQTYDGNSGPTPDSTGSTNYTGGNETRMKNITVNHFIRIN